MSKINDCKEQTYYLYEAAILMGIPFSRLLGCLQRLGINNEEDCPEWFQEQGLVIIADEYVEDEDGKEVFAGTAMKLTLKGLERIGKLIKQGGAYGNN